MKTDVYWAKMTAAGVRPPCFCAIEDGAERWVQKAEDVLPLFRPHNHTRVFLVRWESTGPGEGRYHVSMVDKSIVEQMSVNPQPMPPELPLREPAREGK